MDTDKIHKVKLREYETNVITELNMETDNQNNTKLEKINDESNRDNNTINDSKEKNKRLGIYVNNPEMEKYSYKDIGPYVIHVKHKDYNVGNIGLHPTKIGKLIYETGIQNIKEVRRLNKNTIEIIFKTYQDANKALEHEIWKINNYIVFIPLNKIRSTGILRGVHQMYSEEEILHQIESNVPVIAVQRFNRRIYEDNNYKFIPTQTVKITFKSQYLPEAIYIYIYMYIILDFL